VSCAATRSEKSNLFAKKVENSMGDDQQPVSLNSIFGGISIIAWGRFARLERFRAKWIPVCVKKTRQNKNLEPRSDSIGTGRL
jgi:hypothetical protein